MYEILTPILAGLLALLMAYIIYRRDELFALTVELDKKRCARLAARSQKCEACTCQESGDECEFSLLAAAITGYYPLIKNQSGRFCGRGIKKEDEKNGI